MATSQNITKYAIVNRILTTKSYPSQAFLRRIVRLVRVMVPGPCSLEAACLGERNRTSWGGGGIPRSSCFPLLKANHVLLTLSNQPFSSLHALLPQELNPLFLLRPCDINSISGRTAYGTDLFGHSYAEFNHQHRACDSR